jgi:hypothetical protein
MANQFLRASQSTFFETIGNHKHPPDLQQRHLHHPRPATLLQPLQLLVMSQSTCSKQLRKQVKAFVAVPDVVAAVVAAVAPPLRLD